MRGRGPGALEVRKRKRELQGPEAWPNLKFRDRDAADRPGTIWRPNTVSYTQLPELSWPNMSPSMDLRISGKKGGSI